MVNRSVPAACVASAASSTSSEAPRRRTTALDDDDPVRAGAGGPGRRDGPRGMLGDRSAPRVRGPSCRHADRTSARPRATAAKRIWRIGPPAGRSRKPTPRGAGPWGRANPSRSLQRRRVLGEVGDHAGLRAAMHDRPGRPARRRPSRARTARRRRRPDCRARFRRSTHPMGTGRPSATADAAPSHASPTEPVSSVRPGPTRSSVEIRPPRPSSRACGIRAPGVATVGKRTRRRLRADIGRFDRHGPVDIPHVLGEAIGRATSVRPLASDRLCRPTGSVLLDLRVEQIGGRPATQHPRQLPRQAKTRRRRPCSGRVPRTAACGGPRRRSGTFGRPGSGPPPGR